LPNEKHQDLPRLGGNILDAFVGFSGVFSKDNPDPSSTVKKLNRL